MSLLTDRTFATGVTLNDLIHVVITGDTSQNPAGSSFKASISQLLPSLSGLTFSGGSGNCITDLYVTNVYGCSPINVFDLTNFQSGLTTNIISGNTQGNIEIFPISGISGNSVVFHGNVLPGSNWSLGSPSAAWSKVWIQSNSLQILPDAPFTGETITLSNENDFLRVQSGGFIVESTSGVTPSTGVFQVDPGGQIFITSSYVNPLNTAVLEIIGNDSGYTVYPLNPGAMIHVTGHDNLNSRIINDSYGDTNWSQYGGRNAGGTAQFPTATKVGPMARYAGIGYRPGAGFGNLGDLPASWIDFYSKGTFTSGSTPTEMRFYTTKTNEYQGSLSMVLEPSGITLSQSGSSITFGDTSIQNTAYLGTATTSIIGGVKPDGTTITITSGGTISAVSTPTFVGGSYGSFVSTVDQTNGVAGQTYKMSADTVVISSGVTISGGSRFVVANPGVYNIQFSAQFSKTNGTKSNLFIWLVKNGTNVPISNTEIVMDKGGGERELAAWNWVEQTTTPNEYFEIAWTDTQGNVILDYVASPTYGPAIPSVIVTLTQV